MCALLIKVIGRGENSAKEFEIAFDVKTNTPKSLEWKSRRMAKRSEQYGQGQQACELRSVVVCIQIHIQFRWKNMDAIRKYNIF